MASTQDLALHYFEGHVEKKFKQFKGNFLSVLSEKVDNYYPTLKFIDWKNCFKGFVFYVCKNASEDRKLEVLKWLTNAQYVNTILMDELIRQIDKARNGLNHLFHQKYGPDADIGTSLSIEDSLIPLLNDDQLAAITADIVHLAENEIIKLQAANPIGVPKITPAPLAPEDPLEERIEQVIEQLAPPKNQPIGVPIMQPIIATKNSGKT
jgi:hypothetical protein